jgi:molybdopterin-guanine dinucleotide biosynthesis protein A
MTARLSRSDLTAIVLAGGRSTRFGSDKLAADAGGITVLHRAIAAVAEIAGEVIAAGAASGSLPVIEGTSIRAVVDREPFGGPLQALAGAFDETTTRAAIVVAGDMQSLVPSVLRLLWDVLAGNADVDAAVLADPRDPTRRQPLPVALRVEPARAAAVAALEAGDRSLVRLLDRLALVEVPAAEWHSLDPEGRTLADVDVPDDLRRVRDTPPDRRIG